MDMKNKDRDDLIRKIVDKQVLDALTLLKSVNQEKSKLVESKIKNYFERIGGLVTFDVYQKLVKDLDAEPKIHFQRRNDSYGLDEIDEDF